MLLDSMPTLLCSLLLAPVDSAATTPIGSEAPDASAPAPAPAAPRPPSPRDPGLRPSTKPHELGVGLGLRIPLPPPGLMGTVPLHYLYHLNEGGAGPAVGGVVDFGFTRNIAGRVFTTQVGPAFRWDFQPSSDLGLYVGPQVAAGYGLYTVTSPGYDPFIYHGGFLQVAGNVRLVLDDVGFVFARPVQLTAVFVRSGAGVTYDLIVGGGVTF